jgi:lysophospholipase L1-like esterase
VLTPADVAAISAVVAQSNARLRQVATARGWAFADLDAVYNGMAVESGGYSARDQLGCALPYGYKFSLDGIHPSAEGQATIANAVITAINTKYGFELPVPAGPILELRPRPCP